MVYTSKKHNDGYEKATSSTQGKKISMAAESMEGIITKEGTPTGTSLSLSVHRITGSTEATTPLHRLGVGISYNNVRLITNYWASCITLNYRGMLSPGSSLNFH